MDKLIKKSNAIAFYLFILLFSLLPFHAFLITFSNHLFGFSNASFFIISAWKEIILVLLACFVGIRLFFEKKIPFKAIMLDKLIIGLFFLALLSAVYGTKNVSQTIWGLRTDFIFFVAYFSARTFLDSKKKILSLVKVLFITSSAVVLFGIIQALFLPKDFLLRFGYALSGWEPGSPLQAYQPIGNNSNLFRIISTMSGALQLGGFTMFTALFFGSMSIKKKKRTERYKYLLLSFGSFAVLYFTYTRSAWLGALVGLCVILYLSIKKKLLFWGIASVIIFFILSLGVYLFSNNLLTNNNLRDIIIHQNSTSLHGEKMREGFSLLKKNYLGYGIGTAGPATFRFKNQIISENWYLQIALEMGILGLILFAGIIVETLRNLYMSFVNSGEIYTKSLSLGLFSSLVAIFVMAFFLHPWGDNVVLAIIFWSLVGGAVSLEDKKLKRKVARRKRSIVG